MRGWSWFAGFLILVLGIGLAGCASRADHEGCRRQLRETRGEVFRVRTENRRLRDHLEEIKRSLSWIELLDHFKGKLDTLEALLDERKGRPGKTEAGKLDLEYLTDLLSQMRLIVRILKDIGTRTMDDRDAYEKRMAPAIQANVTNVNAKLKYVMLSAGREDRVTKGLRFFIYRKKSYIGEVQVDTVYPVVSSASIVHVCPRMNIEKGDSSTTRP